MAGISGEQGESYPGLLINLWTSKNRGGGERRDCFDWGKAGYHGEKNRDNLSKYGSLSLFGLPKENRYGRGFVLIRARKLCRYQRGNRKP